MITNERQYKITNSQIAKLKEGVDAFDLEEVAKKIGSKVLAKAELEGLKSEIEILEGQLQEYESLKSGAITNFQANSLDELYLVLIQARIAQQLSQKQLGELIGLQEQQIQRYESEKYASASLRRIKEVANALKLNITEIAEINLTSKNVPEKTDLLNWAKFPVKEMYNRGWFEGFEGSIDELFREANSLVEDFVKSFFNQPALALHHKSRRLGSKLDSYSLLAWECRILNLASKVKIVQKYKANSLTPQWFDELRKLSKESDGPIRAKEMLEKAGIVLIIEPHLPNTYLDGAAILWNGNLPVIGMTLRYNRLDNFWFVLFHELVHIMKHLEKGKLENIVDDLDMESKDEIELEADALSRDLLISNEEWSHAIPRFIRSDEAIKSFASEINVNPAIVAGRIRYEANNFRILSHLVGQDEVRKQFKVSFGV